jgi:hypothetical protein
MYKNKFTGIILTDEEYWRMRKREIQEEWNNLTEKERKEWTSYQEFEKWDLDRNVDLDYEYLKD